MKKYLFLILTMTAILLAGCSSSKKETEQTASQTTEKATQQETEQTTEKAAQQETEQTTEKAQQETEKAAQQETEQTTEQAAQQETEQTTEKAQQTTEQAVQQETEQITEQAVQQETEQAAQQETEEKSMTKAADAQETEAGSADGAEEKVDLDLSVMSGTVVYAEVFNMLCEPEKYMGKTVKMKGLFNVFYSEPTDTYYFACVIQDATACCAQGIEFVLEEERNYPEDYPEIGEEITVTGVFDTYKEGEDEYCTLRKAKMIV